MMKQSTNPCTRCGKERILFKSWTEEVPTFGDKIMIITRELTVCPDAECQKIVAAELAVQKKKRDKIKSDREEKLVEAAEKKRVAKEELLKESLKDTE